MKLTRAEYLNLAKNSHYKLRLKKDASIIYSVELVSYSMQEETIIVKFLNISDSLVVIDLDKIRELKFLPTQYNFNVRTVYVKVMGTLFHEINHQKRGLDYTEIIKVRINFDMISGEKDFNWYMKEYILNPYFRGWGGFLHSDKENYEKYLQENKSDKKKINSQFDIDESTEKFLKNIMVSWGYSSNFLDYFYGDFVMLLMLKEKRLELKDALFEWRGTEI